MRPDSKSTFLRRTLIIATAAFILLLGGVIYAKSGTNDDNHGYGMSSRNESTSDRNHMGIMSGERNAPADNPSLRSILSTDPEISKLYYEISLINSLNKLGITSDQAATILDIIQSSRESIDSDYNRLKMKMIEELKQELDSVLQGAELDPGRITQIRPVSYSVESQQVILDLSPVRIRVLDTLTPEQQSNINQCLAIYGDDTSGIAGQESGMHVIHGTYRTGADASQTSADVERALDEMILNQTTVEALRLYIDSR